MLRNCLTRAQFFERANKTAIHKFSTKYDIKQSIPDSYYNEAIKWAKHIHKAAQKEN